MLLAHQAAAPKPQTHDATPAKNAPPPAPPPAIVAAAVVEPGPSGQPTEKSEAPAAAPPAPPAVKRSISGPFGPWYYPARYLHRRVTPLKPIWPVYPEGATTISGRVTILLLVDEYGQVDQHRIIHAEPSGVFEAAVVEAFARHARFAPGLITGYPVKGQLVAEVTFEPGAMPQTSFSVMDPQQSPIMGLPAASVATPAPAAAPPPSPPR